jgi:hypothetical protein
MKQSNDLRYRKLPLRGGSGTMPALGFGTLIPDATETRSLAQFPARTPLPAKASHFVASVFSSESPRSE